MNEEYWRVFCNREDDKVKMYRIPVNLKMKEQIRRLANANGETIDLVVNVALSRWDKYTDDEKIKRIHENFENTLDEYSMTRLNFYMTPEQNEKLKEEAKRLGFLSRQALIRNAIYSFVRESQVEQAEEKVQEIQEKVEVYDKYDLINTYYDYLDGLKQLSDKIREENTTMEEEDAKCPIPDYENDLLYKQILDRLQRFNEKLSRMVKDTDKVIKGYKPIWKDEE